MLMHISISISLDIDIDIYDVHSVDTAMDDSNIGHYTGALSGSMGTGGAVAMFVFQMRKVFPFFVAL